MLFCICNENLMHAQICFFVLSSFCIRCIAILPVPFIPSICPLGTNKTVFNRFVIIQPKVKPHFEGDAGQLHSF